MNFFNYFIPQSLLFYFVSFLSKSSSSISWCFQASTCLTSTGLTRADRTAPALPAFPPRTDAPTPSSPWQPFAGLSPVSQSLSNTGEPSSFPESSPEILHSPGTHCTPIPLLPSAQPVTQNNFALLSVLSGVFYQFNLELNKVELTKQGEAKERSACPSLPIQMNPSTKCQMNL